MALLPALAGAGCSRAPQAPAPTHLDLGEAEMIKIGFGYPRVRFRAHMFESELRSSGTVHLDRGYTLEYVPVVRKPVELQRMIKAYIIVDGAETELTAERPRPLVTNGGDANEWLAAVLSPTRVDLAPFTGKSVAFRWAFTPGDEQRQAGIANVRLRAHEFDAPRPDILMVCSDTHRFDFPYRSDDGADAMPMLRPYLENATYYLNAFSSASWTLPSIASTFTGLAARYHSTGLRSEVLDESQLDSAEIPPGLFLFHAGGSPCVLTSYPKQLRSLWEDLGDAGYTTVVIAANPLYFLSGLAYDGTDLSVATAITDGLSLTELAATVTRNAPADRPLFLLVHYMNVHQWNAWYFGKMNPGVRPRQAPDRVSEAYRAAVLDTDRYASALLEEWSASRSLDESLTILFSDHGEHLFDAGGSRKLGHGNSMDEVLLHVPLCIRYPLGAHVGGGAVERPVALIDLVPTIGDLLDIDMRERHLSGLSLLSRGDATPGDGRIFFADYQLHGDQLSSVRCGHHKLVVNLDDGTTSLFETQGPAGVLTERRVEDPEKQKLLMDAHREYAANAEEMAAGLVFDQEIDQEEALEQLRALGYVR